MVLRGKPDHLVVSVTLQHVAKSLSPFVTVWPSWSNLCYCYGSGVSTCLVVRGGGYHCEFFFFILVQIFCSVWMLLMTGRVENAEVRKPKYGSEKNSRPSFLIDSRMCVLRFCRQKVTLSLRCESRIFGSRTAASVAITNCAMCMWQPDPNQDKWWVHEPTMWALCSSLA